MTEGILTITLLTGAMFLHRKADKEAKRVAMKNRGKAIAFAPNPVFMIPQSNDARFHTKGAEIIILFDCEDTHGRDGARRSFFTQSTVFPKGDLPERTHTLDAPFFFEVTLQPNIAIRM
jgi:hypothetical protein